MNDLSNFEAPALAGHYLFPELEEAGIVNNSGLEPLGRAILVEPFEPERVKSALVLPDSVLRSERAMDVKVRVIVVGPWCWKSERADGADEPARCAPGDVIFVARMSGFIAIGPRDGKMYRLVNDRDVFTRVTWFGEVQS